MIQVNSKETTIRAIKGLGQDLINKAEDICNDLTKVTSITVYTSLTYGEVANFDITKNYAVTNID